MRSYHDQILENQKAKDKLGKALRQLEDLHVPAIMAEMNTHSIVDASAQHYPTLVAMDAAERRGWDAAINTLFSLLDPKEPEAIQDPELEFGASRKLQELGYTTGGE